VVKVSSFVSFGITTVFEPNTHFETSSFFLSMNLLKVSVLLFWIIATANPFAKIKIGSSGDLDVFGVDDIIVATPSQVIGSGKSGKSSKRSKSIKSTNKPNGPAMIPEFDIKETSNGMSIDNKNSLLYKIHDMEKFLRD
jgi:hypothetical protein